MKKSAFISELKENLQKRDFIKIKVLISQLQQLPVFEQQRFIMEISKIDSEFSIQVLAYLASIEVKLIIPQSRIDALLLEKIIEQPDSLNRLFLNPEIANNKVLIDLAVEIQPAGIESTLTQLYREVRSADCRSLLLKTLVEIGTDEATRTMAELVSIDEPNSWIPIVTSIGAMETQTAVNSLLDMMGQDIELDRTILQTCEEMQIPMSKKILVESLHSRSVEIRKKAKVLIKKSPQEVLPHLMNNLSSNDTDFVIQALNMLGELGNSLAVKPIKKLLKSDPDDSNVRFAAYESLGMLAIEKGLFSIVNGLADPDPSVRVAAASALNANHNEVVLFGIKNMLNDSDNQVDQITEAFIHAFADEMVISLYTQPVFRKYADTFLVQEAHPDIRNYYVNLFAKKGQSEWAEKISVGSDEVKEEEQRVIVVDDSKMILNIFRQSLHKINIDAETFEFPLEALESIMSDKPSIVFTDLNMPLLTGIELTVRLREKYNSDELPIIMVTTQSDGDDHDQAFNAGVNKIMNKPFTSDQLEEAIASVKPKRITA